MEFALIIWAITTLFPGIQLACMVLLAVLVIVLIIRYIIADCTYDREEASLNFQRTHAFFASSRGWMVAMILLLVIVPSQKNAWMIAGAGAAQAIATSDFAQELGAEAKDMLKEMMKRGTVELREQAQAAVKEETK